MTKATTKYLAISLIVLASVYLLAWGQGLIESSAALREFDFTTGQVPKTPLGSRIAMWVGFANLVVFIYYVLCDGKSKRRLWWILLLPLGSLVIGVGALRDKP